MMPSNAADLIAQATIGRTVAIARPSLRRVALACILGAGAIAADIGLIATAAWLISTAALHPNESALGLAIVGVQFFGLTRGFFRYEERLVGHDAAFRMLAAVRVRVYQKLERLAPEGIPAFRRGDLLVRMVRDVDSLQDVNLRIIPPFAIAVLVGLGSVAMMTWILPAAGLVMGATFLVAVTVVPWLTSTLTHRREARFAQVRGDMGTAVVDLIEGAPELMAFGAMDSQLATVARTDGAMAELATASAGTAGIGLALSTFLVGVACWGCLMVGIPAVRSGHLDGVMLAVIVLVPLAAFEMVSGLPVALQALGKTRQAAARVFEVTDAVEPVVDPVPPAALPQGPPTIAIRSMDARHAGMGAPAVSQVDLTLVPERRLAIVGPSGSGKSSLAAVLLRFLSPESGEVTLNGVPYDCLNGDDLRSVVGLVSQDAHLFETSVAENLRIGRRQASDAELRDVMDRVGLMPWLQQLPQGLSTDVGRFGDRLSGGQRQRVALARALLADFPVLILDEPAEHLEREAADVLISDMLATTRGRSVVLITHRMQGLDAVDEIIVMDRGRIVERGSHQQLIDAGGVYAASWAEELKDAASASPLAGVAS
jgi:thiol reductant ABC exporter CydC subunit